MKNMSKRNIIKLLLGGIILLVIGFSWGSLTTHPNIVEKIVYKPVTVIKPCGDEFSENLLYSRLKKLKVKYPHVVIAQARLESNNYKSNLFRMHNNLFGMRVAGNRIRTANNKSNSGYASYESWIDSMLDYAFYQASYMSEVKSEREYVKYISQNYSESGDYQAKITEMSKKVKKQYSK